MTLGKVIGNIVSTVKHEAYHATKIMIVQPLGWDLQPQGGPTIAVDTVGAGEGETVLILREGQAAKQILGVKRAPVRSLIVGIIDHVDIARET
ncbi:MAG: EutN/CcmL family microcompartment protein [Candidatus Latescibacteria bacterium]|nr:EutN/CcmL family microcompartment protein [Candidatus Latescibacterota bacterium]